MRSLKNIAVSISLIAMTGAADAQATQRYALSGIAGLTLKGVRAEAVVHKGRRAVRLTEIESYSGETAALLDGTDLENGTIEVNLAGRPRAGAPEGSRGFVGIAFRIQGELAKYEYVYLRPTNARSDDQLRRNHSTEYASEPDYPWQRLRKESPGVYESYADMEPGEWIKLKLVVDGVQARLYLNGAPQPCLVVNDLKLGVSHGPIGLWIGQGTEAFFSGLEVTPASRRLR
jgi:hypothetical protein